MDVKTISLMGITQKVSNNYCKSQTFGCSDFFHLKYKIIFKLLAYHILNSEKKTTPNFNELKGDHFQPSYGL